MISIIIPVYNAEKYLARCVESVLGQSYVDFEVILIDDGSSDGSALVCQQFATKDSRVRYVWQNNQGAGAARRAGVLEARGEYVFFLDSDDYLSADALQDLMLSMEPDVDCVVGQHLRFGEMENIRQVSFPLGCLDIRANSDVALVKMTVHNLYGQELWNKLFRASIVKETFLARDVRVPYGEDSLYLIELYLRMRKLKCIENLTYYYEFRLDSLARRTQTVKLLSDFARECHVLQKTMGAFSLQDSKPLLILHILNIALVKYRGEEGIGALCKDFANLYNDEFIAHAKYFLKRKKSLQKKYALDKKQYYYMIGVYKTIVKKDPWYYVKWYPLKIDSSISIGVRFKIYARKVFWRKQYERNGR